MLLFVNITAVILSQHHLMKLLLYPELIDDCKLLSNQSYTSLLKVLFRGPTVQNSNFISSFLYISVFFELPMFFSTWKSLFFFFFF